MSFGVILLGTVGFLRLYPDFTVLDAIYNAVPLLGFGGDLTAPLPWQLDVARILGPLLVGYAAVRGILALTREQVTLVMFRLFLRDHVVVVGLSDTGFALALRLYEAGARIVVIERDPAQPSVEGCKERGIPVVLGDATDPRVLDKARTGQARILIAAAGDDGLNVDVAAGAAELARNRRHGVLSVFARVDDPMLHAALESWILREHQGSAFRLETFNIKATAARLLVARYSPFTGGRSPRTIVAGDGHLVEAIALDAARSWLAEDRASEPAAIIIAGPEATRITGAFEKRLEHDADRFEVETLEIGLEEAAPALAGEVRRASSVYAAFEDEAQNLALAISLGATAGPDAAPIVAVVREEDSGAAALLASGTGVASIASFGILTRALTPDLVLSGRTEILAQAMHQGYCATQAKAGESADSNPSLVPWEELPESLRESNRSFAAGIGSKLKAARFIAVPSMAARPDTDEAWVSGSELEDLARMEHERWSRDLSQQGWRHGPSRDPKLKTHPSLIPYGELSEAEKAKDRDAVLEIPTILGRAGFELQRVD